MYNNGNGKRQRKNGQWKIVQRENSATKNNGKKKWQHEITVWNNEKGKRPWRKTAN